MDTVISRMMQLLGAVLVLGMVVSGVEAVQLQNWDGAIAFLCFAVFSAGMFTTIWTMSTYHITALIGKQHKRSDFTDKSIVGTSVGVLALFTAVGFVTAGLSATNEPQFPEGDREGGLLSHVSDGPHQAARVEQHHESSRPA